MPRSIEELSKQKTIDLRKLAGQMMKENNLVFTVNGLELPRSTVQSRAHKEDLIYHISMWESQLEKQPTPEPQPEPTPEPQPEPQPEPAQEATAEITKSDELKLGIAKTIYYSTENKDDLVGLREYFKILQRKQKLYSPEFVVLVGFARQMIEQYSHGVALEGRASANVILKNRLDVMKFLQQLVEAEAHLFDPIADLTLADVYTEFDDCLRKGMRDLSMEKFKTYKQSNNESREDVRPILALPFIEWAKDTLSAVNTFTPARWREVAVACMLLSGRRQSEVMSSGKFTLISENRVIFDGQLKKHSNDIVPPIEIPILGNSALEFTNAINWLEANNKRSLPIERTPKGFQEAAKISHNKCSRYISEQMQLLTKYCPITNGKTWEGIENGKSVNKFKGHLTRQIYAQVTSAMFNNPDNVKKIAYIAKILGESVDAAAMYDRDVKKIAYIAKILGESVDAAAMYDRDVEIKDLETIKEKYGIIE
jgi:hypothetical protein